METLLGDPTKAKEQLGWEPKTSLKELISEMVQHDLKEAEKDYLCKTHGFSTYNYNE